MQHHLNYSIDQMDQIEQDHLFLHGAREDDRIEIRPFQGRKRVIRLKKTLYELISNPREETQVELPSSSGQQYSFRMILVPHSLSDSGHLSGKSRYLLLSENTVPFMLNGAPCFRAFIKRRDRITIGMNEVVVHSKECLQSEKLPIDEQVLKSNLPILLIGETGTGKSYLAKKIHEEGERSGPFVHLNLSAFSKTLVESELFGHIKGAFTGAIQTKRGAILEANHGTLFLDEIDSLSLELQTKLLLFLDSKKVRAVGGHTEEQADVRLVFASGQNLFSLVRQKLMRRDFFYRLSSGETVSLPSLRDNPKRIEEICHEFMERNCFTLAPALLKFYKRYFWPGNIRQLLGHLEKKRVKSSGGIARFGDDDLTLQSEAFQISDQLLERSDEMMSLEVMKKSYATKIYQTSGKNLKHTARVLDIAPNTLRGLLAS